MKVNYDVTMEEIESASSRMSEEGKMIHDFLKGKKDNMCFEYDTDKEAKEKASVVAGTVKRINKDGENLKYAKRGNKIYVMKVKKN